MPQRPRSRRTFLKTTAAASFAAAGAPALLGLEDKAGARRPILSAGNGEMVFEAVHGWGELPAHIRWGNTHGVAVDAEGLIYIKHENHEKDPMDAIAVFSPEGKFVRSFGKEYHRGGHGIDIRKEGGAEYLYLSDIHNRQVVKTTLKGEQVWKLSFPAEPKLYEKLDQFRPTNVAFGPDGGFFVADGYGSNYIHHYDAHAKWLKSWGGGGKEPGKMQTPHGIWLDDRPGRHPTLVVADRANARLQYFDLDGKHLGFFNEVLFPAHFDIQGDVLLVPDLHARVTLLGKDNRVIAHLGDEPHDQAWIDEVKKMRIRNDPKLWPAGKFIHPHDACFDRSGNIFVVEWVAVGRVTKLQRLA